jgi:integrase
METTLRTRTRETGYQTRAGRIRNHLLPALGDLPLIAIRKSHGEKFKLQLKEKGLSPKTANHCIGLGKQILGDAVDEELIDRNPWERLKLVEGTEQRWDWYLPNELMRLLASVREHHRKWELEIRLGARAGLRASEVAGLFVEDCDLRTGDVRIVRDVVHGQVQQCKSIKSNRLLRVPKDLLEELRRRSRYSLLRPEMVLKDDLGRTHRGHPFSLTRDGRLHRYLPKTLERPITGAARKANLRRITHRDLRHTYASHLRLQGVPLEDIRDLLGHSSLQMTMRYAHITAERFAEAAAALEALL